MKIFLEKLKSLQAIDFLMLGVVGICLIVTIFTLVSRSGDSAATADELEDYRVQIVNLTAKRDALVGDASGQISEEDAQLMYRTASVAGNAVAKLQTEYQRSIVYQDGDTMSVPEKIEKTASDLSAYLTDDAQGARVPWFTASNTTTTSKFDWRFATNYSFTEDSVECLWLCFDSRETLVAFATGNYIASQEKFSNIHYYATSYGNSEYRTPDDPVNLWVESLDDSPSYEIDVSQQPTEPVTNPESDPGTTDPANPENPDALPEPGDNSDMPVVLDPNGNPIQLEEGNLGWASEFESEFKSSQEYRDYVQSQQNG